MADRISAPARSANMRAIKSKGMKPEIAVRRLAHSLGYRFRLHRKDLPGKPDLVFSSRMKVIFVHGCFWHQHPDPNCKSSHAPRSNLDYWGPKLARNTKRDAITQVRLAQLGWSSLVLWECELKDEQVLKHQLSEFLR
jgi:DNA mismatch endonuclease, patch repair protein